MSGAAPGFAVNTTQARTQTELLSHVCNQQGWKELKVAKEKGSILWLVRAEDFDNKLLEGFVSFHSRDGAHKAALCCPPSRCSFSSRCFIIACLTQLPAPCVLAVSRLLLASSAQCEAQPARQPHCWHGGDL
mgnify:CR=1 FL=1